jgi:hypothetical protein
MQQAAVAAGSRSPHPSLTTQQATALQQQQQQQAFWAQQQQQQVRTPPPPPLRSLSSSFSHQLQQQQQGVLSPPPSLLQSRASSLSLQQLQEPQTLQEQLVFLDSHLAKVSAALNNVEAEMGATNELQQQQLGIKRQKLLNLRYAAEEKRTGVLQTLMQQQQQQGGVSVQLAAAAGRLPRAPSFASPAGMRDLQRSASFMQQQQQHHHHQGFASGPATGYAASPAAAAAAGVGAAGMSPGNASLHALARTNSATFSSGAVGGSSRGDCNSSWPQSPAAAGSHVLARSASGRVLQGKLLTTMILQNLDNLNSSGALCSTSNACLPVHAIGVAQRVARR